MRVIYCRAPTKQGFSRYGLRRQRHEKETGGGKEASSSVSIVPGDILGETDVSTSKPTRGQYFTAEQATTMKRVVMKFLRLLKFLHPLQIQYLT